MRKIIASILSHPGWTGIGTIVSILALVITYLSLENKTPEPVMVAQPAAVRAPAQERSGNTPTILWEHKIGISSWRNNPLFVGQNLYVGSSGNTWNSSDFLDGIYAFEARTGKKLWFQPSAIDVNDIAFMEGSIVAGNDFGEVVAIAARTGEVRWRTQLDGAVYAKPAYADTGIVVATGKGNLYLLDLADGRIIDQTQVDGGVRAGLVARGSDVFVATESGSIYEFWTFGGFRMSGHVRLVYPDQYGTDLESINLPISRYAQLGDGKFSTPSIYASPLLLDDKMIVGFVRQTGYAYPAVVALTLRNGSFIDELIWYGTDVEGTVGGFGNIRFTPAHFEGSLFFGNPYGNEVYALDAKDGRVLWSTGLGQSMFQHWPSPVVGGGHLYIARHDGYLHKLDPTNGKRLASIFLGINDSAGLAFVEGDQLPGADFRTQWAPAHASSIFASPAYSQGLVAVGSDEGYLYVVEM